jgi:hypothetical protein
MDAIDLHLGGMTAAPPARASEPAPQTPAQPRLEAPPFEGKLQRDAFVSSTVDGNAALRSFIERARVITTFTGESLELPPLPADAGLASPLAD